MMNKFMVRVKVMVRVVYCATPYDRKIAAPDDLR